MLLDTQPHKVPPVTEPIEPWRQLLLDAADLIERTAWRDGKPYHPPVKATRFCVETALCEITPFNLASAPTLFSSALANFANYVHEVPYVWNDTPGRTKEEVLAAMRGAARS